MSEATARTALVTGASAGIGAAFAEAYARRGHDLVLVARRRERLEALAERLAGAHGIRTLCVVADLGEPGAVRHIAAQVEAAGRSVDVLVNNAGFGVPRKFTAEPWEVHAHTLQVMVVAVAELCHACLPAMQARGHGRIINVASVAGLLPGTAGHTQYEAVKAWMIRFSESLAFENRGSGVHVTALCPGFTHTEFHDVTGTRAQVSRFPRFMWWQPERVVAEGIAAVEAGRPVHINGWVYRAIVWVMNVLPRPLVYRLLERQSRRFRKL